MIVRRYPKRPWRSDFVGCANRCIATNAGRAVGICAATHEMVILGHSTPLCADCAKASQRIWDSALGPVAA